MNSCPYLCDIELASEYSLGEIGLNLPEIQSKVETIRENEGVIINKIQTIFSGSPDRFSDPDVETQLYENFIGDEDRTKCEYFLSQLQHGIITPTTIFSDSRLKKLAWRYLHRNYPNKRSSRESEELWNKFVSKRLSTIAEGDDKSYIEENTIKIKNAQNDLAATTKDIEVLSELAARNNLLQEKYL